MPNRRARAQRAASPPVQAYVVSGSADKVLAMSVWTLFTIGLVGLLTLSVLVGLSLGAILGQISREISHLLDSEPGGGPDRTGDRWTLSSPVVWSASSSARPANRV
jgi:hypothetical protein